MKHSRRHSKPQLPFVLMLKLTLQSLTVFLLSLHSLSHAADKTSGTTSSLVPASLIQIPFSSNFYSPYAFVVDKEARKLSIWQQTATGLKEVANFPADLGKRAGAKKSRGDHKTPEGIYFFLERRDGPSLNFDLYGKRAFTTDYPNHFDRIDGKTGDGIWLHAVPDHVPLTRGSRGCVVVRNDVIIDVSRYIMLGRTPILIQERMDMIDANEIAGKANEVAKWLETWRLAWEKKDIDAYMSHYDDTFRATGMNRDQWRAHKERLAKLNQSIQVRFSKPVILTDRDRVVMRFVQDYTSDHHRDIGEKTLFVKKTASGSYRIIGETWAQNSPALARQEMDANSGTTATANCAGEGNGDSSTCARTSTVR